MKKILSFLLIAALSVFTAVAEEPQTEASKEKPSLSVEIIDYPASVYMGDEFLVTAHIQTSEPMSTNFRWLLDGQPVTDYFNDDMFIDRSGIVQMKIPMPFGENWSSVTVAIEINYGDCWVDDTNFYDNFDLVDIQRILPEGAKVDSLVNYPVFHAKIKEGTPLYEGASASSTVLTYLNAGSFAYYRYNTNFPTWAYITCNEHSGYVPFSKLNMLSTNECGLPDLAPEQKEAYVNFKKLDSKTDYLIWVNLERYRVNVFIGEKGNWKLEKSFLATTGANDTPTILGEFECLYREVSWPFDGYYVGPVMRFYGGYAFHSYLLRYDGRPYDARLGRSLSHGCVRLHPDDIQWMIDYIPMKTKVFVK